MNQQKNGLGATRTPDLRRVNSPFEDLKGLFGESNSFNSSFSCPLLSAPQECSKTNNAGLADLELPFTKKELRSYTEARKTGLTKKSEDWIERASKTFWNFTYGIINKKHMDGLLRLALTNYRSESARGKTLTFA